MHVWAWCGLKVRPFQCKSDSVEDLGHSPPRQTENRDFSVQKMKSRYVYRVVTKVFLGYFESFKLTFGVSQVAEFMFGHGVA